MGELDRLARLAEDPLAVTVELHIKLHNNGAMSVSAPIGDPAFCKQLLEEAWEAIKRQTQAGVVVVPGRDVDAKARASYLD